MYPASLRSNPLRLKVTVGPDASFAGLNWRGRWGGLHNLSSRGPKLLTELPARIHCTSGNAKISMPSMRRQSANRVSGLSCPMSERYSPSKSVMTRKEAELDGDTDSSSLAPSQVATV